LKQGFDVSCVRAQLRRHWHVVDIAQPTLGGAMPILPAWNNQISLTQRPYAKILMTSHAFPKLKI
jgi:hypothetical protein